MYRVKLAVLLCSLAVLSACQTSKYAVVAPPAEDHQQISLNTEALITIPKDGDWQWRMPPEEVVKRLISYAGELGKLYGSCQAELAKLTPTVQAKKAPAAATKAAK